MTLHGTASEKNIRKSLRRYLVDALVTAKSRAVTFDTSGLYTTPDLQAKTTDKWYVIKIGRMVRSGLSELHVEIYCCTRGDKEGDKLAELSDDAFEVMTDPDMEDGRRRITLYDATPTEIGKLLVQKILDGEEFSAADKTKYKVLTCVCKWVAKA